MNKGIHFCKIVHLSNDVKRILSKTDRLGLLIPNHLYSVICFKQFWLGRMPVARYAHNLMIWEKQIISFVVVRFSMEGGDRLNFTIKQEIYSKPVSDL